MADHQAAGQSGRPPFFHPDRPHDRPRPTVPGDETQRSYTMTVDRVIAYCVAPAEPPTSDRARSAIADRWSAAARKAAEAIETAIARIRDDGKPSVRLVNPWADAQIRWLECTRCGGSAAAGPAGNERCRFCHERMRLRTRHAGQQATHRAETTRPDGIGSDRPLRASGRVPMHGPGVLMTEQR